MKKNILSLLVLLPVGLLYSQVIIGTGKTQVTNNSVSLEFGTEEKGIVLPWVISANAVTTAATAMVPSQTIPDGTIIFDSTDKSTKLMQAGAWTNLTLLKNGVINLSLQTLPVENPNAKTSIGTPTATPGILVLEDTNKGMVLPQVVSYANISSPEPGMMVYDTTKKLLCFYNGKQWTFWAASN